MKITNILLGLFVFWYITFLAAIAFASDCTYTNVINYNSKGEIVGAKQEYVCKTPPPKIMTQIDPFRSPVEIIYPDSYYNSVEEKEQKQLENIYTIFSIIGRLNS